MSVTEDLRPEACTQPGNSDPHRARMLINGAWVDSLSGATLAVENPAKRRVIATIPRGDAADANGAVEAAAHAFPAWSKVAPRDRGRLLLRIADKMEAEAEEVARTIALETGNALRTQARGEARLAADIFRYFGGLAGELKGETIPFGDQVLSYTRREPLGVVGAIIPWNAPVLLGALKIAPALCAGNTLVLKAAEDAPLGVLMMAETCQEFLPPGVLNVLTGLGEECGGPLALHPAVRKLSFTGSTEVGKIIMRAAAERIVPVSLELGGKSPSIVYLTPTRIGWSAASSPGCASPGKASPAPPGRACSSMPVSLKAFSRGCAQKPRPSSSATRSTRPPISVVSSIISSSPKCAAMWRRGCSGRTPTSCSADCRQRRGLSARAISRSRPCLPMLRTIGG
jgi:hypothetical protein